MAAAWFLLPPRAHAFMFSLNGPLAFPVILASWMLADTPATNVMGSSPALALSVLEDQAAYWRWLAARCIVIGSVIGVACAAGVMYVGVGHYPWSEIVWACALVAFLPVGVLPVAAWLGIVFPFHQRSLRWRWQHRRAWRSHLRWVVLAFAPFFYVPFDRTRHPEPRRGARSVHQAAWPTAHAGPVRYLSGCRLRNSRRRCRHRSLGRTSAPSLADHPPGRLPREHRQGLTRSGLTVEGAPFFLGEPANNGWNTPADAGTRTARVELLGSGNDIPEALPQQRMRLRAKLPRC
jgi:hypothetical protein